MEKKFTRFSRIEVINSSDRISGTHENFQISLPRGIDENYTHMMILQCNIPVSYYLIQTGRNTFTLQEGLSSVVITVPEGNYKNTEFKTMVQGLLNSNSPNGWVYTLSFVKRLGKFTVNVTGNGIIQPSLIFTDGIYEQFGFEPNSTNTFVGDSITSSNFINFNPETTLYLTCDLVEGNGQLLQEIFTTQVEPGGVIQYSNGDLLTTRKIIEQKGSLSFGITLTNERSEIMNLNGRNMVLTLLFTNLV